MGYGNNYQTDTVVNVGVQQADFNAEVNARLSDKAENATELSSKAPQTALDVEKARINNLVAVANASFYQKSTVGITGALLVVASGATTGQINLASVTPLATGYTAVNGDYVLLVYGVSSGSAELIDARVGANGVTYVNAGDAVRLPLAIERGKIDTMFDWQEITSTITSNNAYAGGTVGATIAETATASFRYLVASVIGFSAIRVTYFAQGWLNSVVFTDDTNKIIKLTLTRITADTVEQKTDVEVQVPQNATKIYVNSMTWGNLKVKGKVNTRNSHWFNKICDVLGDSITEQGLWQPYVKSALGFSSMLNHGIGGTSVGGDNVYPESVNSFWQDVRINALSDDADCLIIMGGTNDGGKQIPLGTVAKTTAGSSTVGAYNLMLSKIFYKYYKLATGYYAGFDYSGVVKNATFKDVKIFLVTPTFCPDPVFSGVDFVRMEGIVDAIKKIGAWWNIPVIDNYRNAGINEQNSSVLLADGVHPNAEGAKHLASVIIGGLTSNQPIA